LKTPIFSPSTQERFPMEIRIGNVVQLNGGGPYMTVGHIGNNSDVKCYWFDYQGKVTEWTWKRELLRLVGSQLNEPAGEPTPPAKDSVDVPAPTVPDAVDAVTSRRTRQS